MSAPTLRRRMLKVMAVFALLFVLVPTGKMLLEAAFYPWARSFGLWPVLVGTWHGEMHGATGATAVFVELESLFMGSSNVRHLEPIGGRLRWCASRGVIRDYRISGDVDTWRGTRFRITAYAADGQPFGESPDGLAAEWRGDTIEASGSLWRSGSTATVTDTREGEPAEERPRLRYVLRRGEERDFLAACRGEDPQNGGRD